MANKSPNRAATSSPLSVSASKLAAPPARMAMPNAESMPSPVAAAARTLPRTAKTVATKPDKVPASAPRQTPAAPQNATAKRLTGPAPTSMVAATTTVGTNSAPIAMAIRRYSCQRNARAARSRALPKRRSAAGPASRTDTPRHIRSASTSPTTSIPTISPSSITIGFRGARGRPTLRRPQDTRFDAGYAKNGRWLTANSIAGPSHTVRLQRDPEIRRGALGSTRAPESTLHSMGFSPGARAGFGGGPQNARDREGAIATRQCTSESALFPAQGASEFNRQNAKTPEEERGWGSSKSGPLLAAAPRPEVGRFHE